jgi:hypothetical protein
MNKSIVLATLVIPMVLAVGAATARGTKPVKTGAVIRGITLSPPVGASGTPAAATCSFSGDPVDQNGRLTGSSVNCGPSGTLPQNLLGLPARFNAYCAVNAPMKSARLIEAPIPDDPQHCDLSGITPKDATRQFKGAVWR